MTCKTAPIRGFEVPYQSWSWTAGAAQWEPSVATRLTNRYCILGRCGTAKSVDHSQLVRCLILPEITALRTLRCWHVLDDPSQMHAFICCLLCSSRVILNHESLIVPIRDHQAFNGSSLHSWWWGSAFTSRGLFGCLWATPEAYLPSDNSLLLKISLSFVEISQL